MHEKFEIPAEIKGLEKNLRDSWRSVMQKVLHRYKTASLAYIRLKRMEEYDLAQLTAARWDMEDARADYNEVKQQYESYSKVVKYE